MNNKGKTIFIKYKNPEDSSSKWEKRKIWEYRFNPVCHRKLFFKNWYYDNIKFRKVNWNNPWLVGIGLILITTLLAVIF